VRKLIDFLYVNQRKRIFRHYPNPEDAHKVAIKLSQRIDQLGLSKLLLDNSTNYREGQVIVTNAAGSNKNGDIPPSVMRYLGFQHITVGTVTHEPWPGNPAEQRIWRYDGSLVNWLGLPGIGSHFVSEVLDRYREQIFNSDGTYAIPVRVNLMATPSKKDNEAMIDDMLATIDDLCWVANEWELNISCPNTHSGEGALGGDYQRNLDAMLAAITRSTMKPVYVKLSPDLSRGGLRETLDVGKDHPISGWTEVNTTTSHVKRYIPESPTVDGKAVGGASGEALYELAQKQHLAIVEEITENHASQDWKLNVTGAMNSVDRMRERVDTGKGLVRQVQVYTGGIYKGPGLVRELRKAV